ncbi:MAG: hypothetical protein OEV87_09080 [Phycisphaerae bacterium]|nr:hypothetical protein [Phycisphaerae bacterium]
MAMIKYALEKGQPKRLGISFKNNWNDARVLLDGEEIGAFTDAEHVRRGEEFTLPDGSRLSVQLTGGKMFPMFKILKDGQPLTTMGPSAADRLKMTCNIMYIIAAANLFGGLMGLMGYTAAIMPASVAWYSVAVGAVFGVLAFFAKRKSMLALGIGVALLVLGSITVLVNFQNLSVWAWTGLALRALVLFVLLQGFGAIQALKQEEVAAAT